MYIKTHNKEIGAKLAAHYQAGKPIEIMGKLFLGNSIGFDYPDSCVEFYGPEVSKVAWTGEGLPPVGTVCEYKRVHEWQKVEVFAVKSNYNGSETALFTYENGTWCGCACPSLFRPIRTPEQIAAEDRKAAIKEMIVHIGGSRRCEAEVLYDAGYRKQ